MVKSPNLITLNWIHSNYDYIDFTFIFFALVRTPADTVPVLLEGKGPCTFRGIMDFRFDV